MNSTPGAARNQNRSSDRSDHGGIQSTQPNDLVVRHRVYIDASVAKVFRTLTTAEGWNGWFTHSTILDGKPGGSIAFEWRDFGPDFYTATDQGCILEIVPDQKFSFTWHPGDFETIVTFELRSRGRGCLLDLEDRRYRLTADGAELALQVATGWGEAMALLKFYIESGLTYGAVPRP